MKSKKGCSIPDTDKYPSIAVILDSEQFGRHKEIEAKLRSLLDMKRLSFFTYVESLPTDVMQNEKYIFFTKDNFNFWGLVKADKKNSLYGLWYDMLVDFTKVQDDVFTNKYIMTLVSNSFKVTFGKKYRSFYDFVIDSKKEDDIIKQIDILHDYLKMLLGKK